MPTPAYFAKYPPFPDDVPTADIPVVSYAKLLEKNEGSSTALFEACRALGFFVLDLSGCSTGEAFLNQAVKMFDLDQQLHGLPTDEKMRYAYNPPTSLFG